MPLANNPNILGRGIKVVGGVTPGVGNVSGPASSTDNALVRFDGTTGKLIQNGVTTEADFTGALTGATDQSTVTAAGLAFTNQPANDGVEVLSSDSGDTTQTVTIIGTTNGTDTVVVETVTLNGTTPVATVKTTWGVILAVKKSATTLGTVTVREASADQTITAGLTAAVLSVGVTTVTNTAAYNQLLSMVADGATTKQLGFQGTNTSGTVIYDSQALTGTTVAQSNSQFFTLTEIYRGDLEVARTATVTTNGAWSLTGGGGGVLGFSSGSTAITSNAAFSAGTSLAAATGVNAGNGVHSATVTGTLGSSYGGIAPVIVYAKSVTIKTTGSPADIATIVIPTGITRYTVGTNNGGSVIGFKALAETASGTLAAGVVDIFTGAGGTGTALTAATWNLPASALAMTGTTAAANLVLTAGTLYVRQTADSGNAGTCSFYVVIWPLP